MSALPNSPFVSIDSARVAVDAPVSTDLMADIVIDLNYCATFAGGRAFAAFTTPGAGTWTVPSGIYSCMVEMVGGGGGGATNGGGIYSAGGGSGAYQVYQFTGLVPGTVMNLFVGSGGTKTTDGGIPPVHPNAHDGTASWFSTSGTGAAGGFCGDSFSPVGGAGGVLVNSGTVWGQSTPGTYVNQSAAGISSFENGIGGVAGGPFGGRPAGLYAGPTSLGAGYGEDGLVPGAGGSGGNAHPAGNGADGAIIIRF